MAKKPTYEELEQRVRDLEEENLKKKSVDKALRKSEERFRGFSTASSYGFAIGELTGSIIYGNSAFANMIEVDNTKDVIGINFYDLVTEEGKNEFIETITPIVMKKGRYVGERTLATVKGRQVTTEQNIFLIYDDNGEPAYFANIITDITERKRTEETLRESEEKYRTILESIDESYFEANIAGNFTFFNDSLSKSLGYSNDELLEMNNRDYMAPETSKKIYNLFNQIYRTGNPIKKVTYEIIRKDGSRGFHELSASLMKDQAGQPIGFRGIAHDITERTKAEEALRESEKKYRQLSDSLPQIVFETDEKGNLTFTNRVAFDILGYTREDFEKGLNALQMLIPEDRDRALKNIQRVLKGEKLGGTEYTALAENGRTYPAMIYSNPIIREGKSVGMRGIVADLTEVKRTQEALRESKDNLDKAQEIAHVGSWRRDLKKDQGYWSDEMYRILGLTPGDPETPSREDFLSRVHPSDRERIVSVLKKAVEKKKSFDFEFRTVPIEGSERIVHSLGDVVCDETETPVVLLGTNQDMTERRRFQEQLQQTQKMEAIATLAGGVAHEFNNALMGIMGNIELLKMDLPEDERRDKYFEAMKGSSHRMSRLTDQLLAYAEGGKYQPKDLKLDEFVIETLPILQHDLNPEVRVETHFPKVSYINADHAQMQMVLSAILSNSNEAIEDAGLIRIAAENKDIDEDFTEHRPGLKPGSYVCLTIEDDGKGMDEETRNRIFEPFFTTKFQGRGMGMAAVYGIIKSHDGWIYVDSELGKGTVVRIYLPAIEAKEEVKKEEFPEPTVELAMGEGTILVIEDEKPLVELFRQILERLGYRVLLAETGKQAIELAKTFDGQIDLALLDIKLPDMDGGRVYPLIMEARPDLKVIVCSGYSIHGPAQDIIDAGAEGFIQKPFSIAPFAEKLKEVLEGK